MKHRFLPLFALLFATAGNTLRAQVITNGDNLEQTRNIYGAPTTGDVREIWCNNAAASFNFRQTVDLPNGVYSLTAQAVYRADYNAGTQTNCELFAETGGQTYRTRIHNMGDEPTSDATNLGTLTTMMENAETYRNTLPPFVVTNGEATVGMRNNGPLTYCMNGYWFIWKNTSFQLTEVTDKATLDSVLTVVNAEALALVNAATDEVEKEALQTAITQATASSADIAALQTAILNYRINTATPSQPADLTYMLNNHSFEKGNNTGWTIQGWSNDTGVVGNYGSHVTGNFDYFLFNTWAEGFGITQTVNGLPNGRYSLTAAIASDTGNSVVLTANDRTETFTVTEPAGQDVTLTDFPVTSGRLTFGTAHSPNWYKVDNFRLTYLGFDPTEVLKGMSANLEKAALINRSHLLNTVQTELTEAMQQAQALVDRGEGTRNELNKAANRLSDAIEQAQASAADYEAVHREVTATEEQWYAFGWPGLQALQAVVDEVKNALTGQSFDKERDIRKLQDAVQAYLRSCTVAEGEQADLTAVLANPSFETGDLTGWDVNGNSSDTGIRENSNGTYTMNGAEGKYLFNSWSKQYGISQRVTGLPQGIYAVSFIHATDNGLKVVAFANDSEQVFQHEGDKGKGNGTRVTLDNILVTDGELTLGTKNIDQWGKLDDFQLTYYGKDKTHLMDVITTMLTEADAMFDGQNNKLETESQFIAQARAMSENNSADELYAAATNLRTALHNLYAAYDKQTLSTDFTAVALQNADFSEELAGWTFEGLNSSNANDWLKNGEHYDGNGTNRYFNPEQWGANNWNTSAKQEMKLPAGSYRLSVSARASGNVALSVTVNRNDETTIRKELISENNTDGEWGRGGWNRYHVYFTVAEGDRMEVVLNGATGANHQWMSFDDVTVKRLGAFYVDKSNYPAVTVLGNMSGSHAELTNLLNDVKLTSVDLTSYATDDADTDLDLEVSNPNLLVINGPDNITIHNGIRVTNGKATDAIALNDGFAFGAPAAVEGEVTYTRPFNTDAQGNPMVSNENGANGWQSVVVPFDVTAITAMQNGTEVNLVPTQLYDKTDDTQRPFWLYEVTDGQYTPATSIKANVPYLMSVPNDANLYVDKLNISGNVTFHGEGLATTVLTESVLTTPAYTLTPNYAGPVSGENMYALNEAGSLWCITTAEAPVKSFNAYASLPTTQAEILSFGIFNGKDATGVKETPGENKPAMVMAEEGGIRIEGITGTVNIFTTDGRIAATAACNGSTFIPMQKGLYIAGGKTLIVK
ncbi:MAG: hypothetical protein NC388_00535 [Clostridium sp.]|nr:hypothetical protein [Clostridium sp.]